AKAGEGVFIHHSAVADENTRTIGDTCDDGRLTAGGIVNADAHRRGMKRDSVWSHDRHGADLVQVGTQSDFLLKTRRLETIVGDVKSGVASHPGLAVPVVHAGADLDHTAVGLGIATRPDAF